MAGDHRRAAAGAGAEAYASITRAAVAAQLRDLGVTVKDVREPGRANRKGCERAAIEEAAGLARV